MRKEHMIYTLMMLGALLMSMSASATDYLVTGFETTDDASYVLDVALPLDTTLSDSAKWGLALENSDPPQTVLSTTGDVTIKAPASSAAEWGSQCMEYYCLGTGTELAGMKLIEYNALSAGVNKVTWQFDLRFLNQLPGNQLFIRLQASPTPLYGNNHVCNLNAQGSNTWFRFGGGTSNVDSAAGSFVADTDYQCIITFDDKGSPSIFTDDEVACKVIKDPYGATPETILDTTSSPQPSKVQALPTALSMHGVLQEFCRVQIDNISMTTGDTAVGDWMMFD